MSDQQGTAAIPSKSEIEVTLGGVKHILSLKIEDLEALEAMTGSGIGAIVGRLMEGYKLTELRMIYEVALRRAGKPKKPDEVREMMRHESVATHVRQCFGLIGLALEPLPGPPAPDGVNR